MSTLIHNSNRNRDVNSSRKVTDALYYFILRNKLAKRRIRKLLKKNNYSEAQHVFDTQIIYPNKINNQLLQAHIIKFAKGNQAYLDNLESLYKQYPDDVLVATTYANALINLIV